MIHEGTEAKIRLHYYRDHWPVGTIAKQIGVHSDVVKRVIKQGKHRKKPMNPSIIEPYLGFIRETFESYPHLRATRLLDMLREKGYTGSVYPLRRIKKQLSPLQTKAFLDLKFTPGEQAQVDWGSFGSLDYDGKARKLYAFVVVLSYSRRIFVRYFHDMKTARVLEGLKLAFEYFGGVPRVVLFDNMKTAVLENANTAIRFNPQLLELTSYYHCEPRACNPRSGWEKGRTERAIRYLRESFFVGRQISNIDELNEEVLEWIDRVADKRPWPDETSETVLQAFEREIHALAQLPGDPIDPFEEKSVKVDKKAMIRFDCNRYPIEPRWVGCSVIVRSTHGEVKIYHESQCIGKYSRLWSKGVTAYHPGHQEKIAKVRKIKQYRSSRHALAKELERGEDLLAAWAQRGDSLRSSSRHLLTLIRQYGKDDVQAAAILALENGTPSSSSIAYLLMEEHGSKPLEPELRLPKELANIDFDSESLDCYDQIFLEGDYHGK